MLPARAQPPALVPAPGSHEACAPWTDGATGAEDTWTPPVSRPLPVRDPLRVLLGGLEDVACWVLARVLGGRGAVVQLHAFRLQQVDGGLCRKHAAGAVTEPALAPATVQKLV